MKRFVVDTSVIVSGMITSDPSAASARVLEQMLTGGFTFVLSPDLIEHYARILNRPTLARIHGLHRSQVDILVSTLTANAIIRDPDASAIRAMGPGDQYLIDLVASDSRHVLVAGNIRLSRAKLDLSIISPVALMKLLDAKYRLPWKVGSLGSRS